MPNSNYQPIVLPPGVSRGATSRSTPDRWYDASLVRWRDNVMVPVGGWTPLGVPNCGSTPRVIFGYEAQNGARRIIIGCDGGFYQAWETEFSDITPINFRPDETTLATGGYGIGAFGNDTYGTPRADGEPEDFLLATTNYISMSNFGERLMAVTECDGRLLVFDPAAGPDPRFVEVIAPEGKAMVPRGNRGVVVTDERFVMLIGADGHDRRIAWSGREDYFDWDFDHYAGALTGGETNDTTGVVVGATAVSGTAGYLDLQSSSPLIAIKNVRNAILVFSQTEIFQVEFKGEPFIYGQHCIESNSSLLSAYAIACFDGKAMWPTRTGFKMYDSGYTKPIPCELEDFFIEDLDPNWEWRTHAVVNNVYSEIWFFYCSKSVAAGTGDQTSGGQYGTSAGHTVSPGVPDKYIAYNYEEGWWSKGTLSRTAGIPVRINADPIMADAQGTLYRHEIGEAFTSPGVGRIFASTGAIEPGAGIGTAVVTTNGVLPDSESGYDSTQWTFTTRITPEQNETVYGPYRCRSDGYMDVRFTARQVEIEVEQIKAGRWTLGKPLFDIRPRGRR